MEDLLLPRELGPNDGILMRHGADGRIYIEYGPTEAYELIKLTRKDAKKLRKWLKEYLQETMGDD